MTRTLEVLDALADVLAAKGIEIRGAFARSGVVIAGSREPSTPRDRPSEGEKFVGHFAIPTTDNRGNPFPSSMLLSILLDLYELAGGASFHETVGLWEDEGVCYIDLLIGIEVWSGDRAGLVTLIEKVRALLRQKSIPLRIERSEFVWIGQASAVNL